MNIAFNDVGVEGGLLVALHYYIGFKWLQHSHNLNLVIYGQNTVAFVPSSLGAEK